MFKFRAPASACHEEAIDPDSVCRPEDGRWASMSFANVVALLGVALPPELRAVEASFTVRRVKAGEALHRAGDAFHAIYVVRCGFFKTVSVDSSGDELVLDLPMGGDVIGIDGIDAGHYGADVVALDIGSVAVIPFTQLSELGRRHPGIERLLYSLFGRELARKNSMYWVLSMLSAEARLASFLIEMSERFGRLGYSRHAFALRATREEIGSHLGLKLETISRTMSAFAAKGLIKIDRRDVTLLDLAGLRRIATPRASVDEPKRPDAADPRRGCRATPARPGNRAAAHGAQLGMAA